MSDEINDLIAEARLWPRDGVNEGRLINALADALEAATRVPVQGEPNDDREALARVLYIARDDFALPDRMARAWDAPGPHGRQRWYRYADAVLAAGFSRAAVPDAATELRAERDAALARIAELEATVDAQDRQIEARSGETAAERMFKEELLKAKARIAELEMTVTSASFEFHEQFERAEQAEARIAEAAKLHRPRKHWNSDREYVFVCDECTRINRYGIAQWPCPTAVSLGLNEGENGVS